MVGDSSAKASLPPSAVPSAASAGLVQAKLAAFRAGLSGPLGRLRLALAAFLVLNLLFFLALYRGIGGLQTAMKVIAKDSAPSIIAAQHIKADLADMHANVANILLGEPGKTPQAVKSYEDRQQDLTNHLIEASENITYEDAERAALRKLLNQLWQYQAAVAQARLQHEREAGAGTAPPPGEPPAFLRSYREADRIINEGLFPAADALDKVNVDGLEQEFKDQRAAAFWNMGWVLLSGLALLGTLAATQVFLYRRRPGWNPTLVAASLLTGGSLIYCLILLYTQWGHLRTLKVDAYDSIAVLWRARADAFDANGDESRWLLDRAQAAKYEKAFTTKADRVAQLPQGMSAEQLRSAVNQGQVPAEFRGYLATELNNITFDGERAAAVAILDKWLSYVAIDQQIRQLEKDGKHEAAVQLNLGLKPGESNWAFGQFDEALGKTIAINKGAFDDIFMQKSPATLTKLRWAAWLSVLVLPVLAYLGLRRRLEELALA
jgi:hypothetical protein